MFCERLFLTIEYDFMSVLRVIMSSKSSILKFDFKGRFLIVVREFGLHVWNLEVGVTFVPFYQ